MMLHAVLGLLLGASRAYAAAVFAHFMVGNANNFTLSDWEADIGLAADSHLDAFALNIAYGDDTVPSSLELAFQAAQAKGFHLFFSFDYAGGIAAWPEAEVISLLQQYASNSAYYHYNGQAFVSTFEGPDSAADWINIKASSGCPTGCFFMPDWSSKGADAALKLGGGGIADGLFSWAAWPWANQDMNTYVDGSYYNYMGKNISAPDPGVGMPYMMPASPWFFTNLPGYNKNWLWRGDNLWYDRWVEIIWNQPEFVEIISWNDYGESHYIGPLYDFAYEKDFTIGEPPYNYVKNMPHDGWRKFLPFVVDTYKTGIATITQEGLVGWYRTSPRLSCGTGDTTANTASQLQIEYFPFQVVEDSVFFSALLGSSADVTVSIGGTSQAGSWTYVPDDGIGIYHGSAPFNGRGDVVITLSRGGSTIAEISGGPPISDSCTNGIANWNAWVGEADGDAVSATPTLTRSEQTCINGTGVNNFVGICDFSCMYGYCPISACYCLQVGKPLTPPADTGPMGYPILGEDPSYEGLCAFDCEHHYCPSEACSTVSVPLATPTVSDFSPPACIKGQIAEGASDGLTGLCSFSCTFGFCPIGVCECTDTGALVDSNYLEVDVTGTPEEGLEDFGLCNFACSHGYCPAPVCNGAGGSGVVYIGNTIYLEPSPTVACEPPCTFIWAPSPIDSQSTISFSPVATTVVGGGSTIITTLTPSPITTTAVSFFPVTVTSGETTSSFALTSSLIPRPAVVSVGGVGVTVSFDEPVYKTSTSSVYVLPTTVYVSGGVTQTFSEDQITSLRTITTSTTITTSWTEVSSGASTTTTTAVPIIVAAGGFYWKPVPLPEFPEIEIPRIPSPPSIPTFPCFKFLDIFSIDCPPDKSQPTTHYSSGSPSPTCTASCGSTTDSESSSTCSSASTVTDYWVSCQSSSCTTTSSSVVSGCQVTATATTTGAYCLIADYGESLQEVGDPETVAMSDLTLGTTTTTLPESVQIGSYVYTPTDGVITVSGSTISVVSVTVVEIVTLDGMGATIYPELATTTYVYNWSAWGFGGTPTDPRTVVSTSAKSTTKAPPTTTPTTSSTMPESLATRLVYIQYAEMYEATGGDTIEQGGESAHGPMDLLEDGWVVYSASAGGYNLCEVGTLASVADYTVNPGPTQGYPGVTMTFEAFGTSSCVYYGPSTTDIGSLTCPGVDDIQCIKDPQFGQEITCDLGEILDSSWPDVRCYW